MANEEERNVVFNIFPPPVPVPLVDIGKVECAECGATKSEDGTCEVCREWWALWENE